MRKSVPSPQRGLLEIDWPLFGELCRALALRVSQHYEPDLVLGIAKAGVIPGAVVASILQCEFAAMGVTRRDAGTDPVLVSPPPIPVQGRRILLVDETCDTGHTLKLALRELQSAKPREVKTAVSIRTGDYEPHFHALETDKLIVLPWDREVVIEGELVVRPDLAAYLSGEEWRAHAPPPLRASRSAFTEIRFQQRLGTDILQRGSEVVFATWPAAAGGVLRCYNPGHGWGIASFRTLDDLPGALRNANEASLALRVPSAPPLPPVPARELDLECPAGRDPSTIPHADKLELAAMVARTMRGPDRRVASTRVRYQDSLLETIVVTSEGLSLREVRPELSLSALAVAEERGTVERATGSIASAGHWSELEAWSRSAHLIGERAVLQLHAPPVRSGRYPVVLDQAAAGVLAHRAVGHLCEADSGGAGPLPLGSRMGGEAVTIGDDGTAFGRRGTVSFDHEGVAPVPTILVQHGVVVGHVHTRMSAARTGAGPTGSARGASGEPPRARLSNTYVASGRGSLADLLGDIDLGVYVADPVGASLEDSRAGLRAGQARMIRKGQLAEPVKGVTLHADPLALLGLVDRVAADFAWSTSVSSCDRAGAGRLPVGTGGPHVRLIEASIGGTG